MHKDNMKIRPIIGWNTDDSVIHLVYRDTDGKKRVYDVDDFKWYFCIHKAEVNINVKEIIRECKRKGIVYKVTEIKDHYKIYCVGDRRHKAVSYLINRLKYTGIEMKEVDISLTKRYMIDNMIEIEEDLKVLYFDIETDDSKGGIVIGRDQIISWAACDQNGKTYFSRVKELGNEKEERRIIKELVKLFIEHDLVISWNGAQFDMPYIMRRIDALDIRTKTGELLYETNIWKHFIHLDMMKRFIKLFGPSMTMLGLMGFSLNEVARVFVQDQKVERNERIVDLFANDPKKLEEYNIKDARLMYDINEKMRTLPLMIKECLWTGTFMDRFYIGELLDNYILREASSQNFFLKSRPDWEESQNVEGLQIKGGFVMNPKIGMYSNIRVFDFKSLYPSIIVSWNVGQETLVDGEISERAQNNYKKWIGDRKIEDVDYVEWYRFLEEQNKIFNPNKEYLQTSNNQFFRKDKTSIIASLIKKLLQERVNYKKMQLTSKYGSVDYKNAQASQEAVKEMANSMYGITADKQSRFFDPRIAEAITVTGQFVNRTTMSFLKKMGHESIYGDTDSIFTIIDDDEEAKKVVDILNERLRKHLIQRYKFNDCIVLIEYEKKFRKFVLVDKKRYSGHLVDIDGQTVDSIYTKGLENVRKSTIEFTRKKMIECLNLLLREDKDVIFMEKWLTDIKKQVMNDEINGEDLSITMKISKPISHYKSKPPHVRLAEQLIKENKILETQEGKHTWGEKIEYIVVDSKNKNESILLSDFKGNWDRKYYWDVQIFAPIKRVLSATYPDVDWNLHEFEYVEKIEKKKLQAEKKAERERIKEENRIKREQKKELKQRKTLKMKDLKFEQATLGF